MKDRNTEIMNNLKEKVKEKEKDIKEKIEESEAKEKESTSMFTSFIKIIVFFIELILIPFFLLTVFGIINTIIISFGKETFIGLLILLMAIAALEVWMFILLGKVILDRKIKLIKTIFVFVLIMIVFIAGLAFSIKDFSKVEFVSSKKYNNANVAKSLPLNELFRTEIDGMGTPNLILNDNLDNECILNVKYYNNIGDVVIAKESEGVYSINYDSSLKRVFKTFFANLKNNEVYDYTKITKTKITLEVNEKDLSKIYLDKGYYLNGKLIKPEFKLTK